jgi:hypothetical protein
LLLPLLVPRTRPGPSDKAGGSTQDQTPSCCDWPTRPAQHAGYVEEAYQNGCNGQSLLVTLSSLQSGRLAPTSANPTISDPSISRSLDVANNNIQPKLRRAEDAAGRARLWMAGAAIYITITAGWPGQGTVLALWERIVRANNGWYRLHAKNRRCSK